MKPKVVLAFSGGLDTSYCAKYLSDEKGLEVHAALVQTGGFSADELQAIEQRAHSLGVASYICLDVTQEYYDKCIKYLVFGNILRNGTYPLSVSSERMFQAMATARYALSIGATYIAHGSTGAGNDQVRFDLAYQLLAPQLQIIAPIREKRLAREEEIEYLKQKGIAGNWEKAAYSINAGIWGTSIGGKETLAAKDPLPESAYPTPLLADAQASEVVCLHYEIGELKGIDQEFFIRPIEAIQALAARAKPYAVGRNMHTGDTIIGIKGRIGFEAAAALITIGAHHTLEKHTLTKWQMYWKEQLANWYGMFLHEAQYFEPVMRQIETFLEQTQTHVSGKVWVKLMPYHFEIQGIESASDLMNSSFGSYGEMNNAWTAEDAKGFIKLLANPLQLYYSVHPDERNL